MFLSAAFEAHVKRTAVAALLAMVSFQMISSGLRWLSGHMAAAPGMRLFADISFLLSVPAMAVFFLTWALVARSWWGRLALGLLGALPVATIVWWCATWRP